ncbi:hypothetical protein PHYBOEH_007094 [Phytophthora boehmeriae]|uniref:Tudor domain-containing protein n=1 Tax=Phytophthora boehmeriae TaxID=109152 RepID=A0A8T1X2R9_9STRA|nr:hypothetical protein PHYBOEH_007094 [Phytophthora boehmeriae]
MSSVYSTDLETSALVESASASVSKSAAASEAYDDESFDDYSDSFESDTEAPSPEASVVSIAPALLRVGTRVQVYWEEENEWFDGVVRAVEEGNKPRYYVHYDDGEQAWEVAYCS